MFKKIISVGLLIAVLSVTSSISVFAQAKLSDENQPVSVKTENVKLRETFLKKETTSNFDKKETMTDYKKQTAQGKKFSTKTKVLIGVGVGVAILATILVVRFKVNE